MVIDLRNNPGGSKNAVADLARRLLGMYLQPGLGLPEAQVDDRGIASSQPVLWLENPSLAAGAVASPLTANAQRQQAGLLRGLKNIMVLTSRNTCSAAELLIHGLQKHLPSTIRFATVGDTTCGKPHGYKEHDYFGTTIFVVHLTLLDAANQPAYPNGIAPNCQVKDLILGPEAGDYDLVFQAAINYAQQGKCQ